MYILHAHARFLAVANAFFDANVARASQVWEDYRESHSQLLSVVKRGYNVQLSSHNIIAIFVSHKLRARDSHDLRRRDEHQKTRGSFNYNNRSNRRLSSLAD